MKIHPDHVEGVRQSEQTRPDKVGRPQDGFADLLDEEVSKTASTQAKAASTVLPPLVGRVLPSEAAEAPQGAGSETRDTVAAMDGLLDQWEKYAAGLSSGGSLKDADAALQDIEGEVAKVKDMASDDSGLKAIADELEVLTTTERIKFNRGDYL